MEMSIDRDEIRAAEDRLMQYNADQNLDPSYKYGGGLRDDRKTLSNAWLEIRFSDGKPLKKPKPNRPGQSVPLHHPTPVLDAIYPWCYIVGTMILIGIVLWAKR